MNETNEKKSSKKKLAAIAVTTLAVAVSGTALLNDNSEEKLIDNNSSIVETIDYDSVSTPEPTPEIIIETPTPSPEIVVETPEPTPEAVGEMVYVTDYGEKYHRGSCRYLKNRDYSEISIERADKYYSPCSVCNP